MNALERYLIFGLRKVDGWLDPGSAEVIAALAAAQRAAGHCGAVGEIGVHHGKLFIVLLLTAAADEASFAIDVFEQQDLNSDQSGRGDRVRFLENMRQWGVGDRRISIIARSSLEVRADDIIGRCGRVRLASIDGGHTRECTINDLRLMEGVLAERGIVVVDDYFNCSWPDVSAGVAEYLFDRDSRLRPFAISPNKLYLTAPANSEFYRAQIRRQFPLGKTSQMFGADVDIYHLAPQEQHLRHHLKLALKQSTAGPYLLAAKSRVASLWRTRAAAVVGKRESSEAGS